MTIRLRAETLAFLETAPRRWHFEAMVDAAPHVVFDAISGDPSTWTWFPGFTSGRYVGPGPHGVGSIREIKVGPSIYRETIIACDPPTRWAYRVDETTLPLAKALVEEWAIRPSGAGSLVRWTFAIDPGVLFRVSLPMVPLVMGRVFRNGMRNLNATLSRSPR